MPATTSFPWNGVNATVQSDIEPFLWDQIFLSNALYNKLKPSIKKKTGGRSWAFRLIWKEEGGGGGWFNGVDRLNTTIYDPIQACEVTPKNGYVPLAIDWETEMQVSGPEAVGDLVEDKTEIARQTAVKLLNNNLYNAGTDAKAITGLQASLKDWTSNTAAPSQTYAGITRQVTGMAAGGYTGTNTWWYHGGRVNDGSANYTTGPTGTFCGENLRALGSAFARIRKQSGKSPDLIVSNVYSWTDFHNNLVKNERFPKPQRNDALYNAGFDNIMYRSAAWVQDEMAPRDETTHIEKVYVLNTKSWVFACDPRAMLSWTGFREPYDQMARVGYFLWRGEIVCVEPRANFVFSAIDTTLVE